MANTITQYGVTILEISPELEAKAREAQDKAADPNAYQKVIDDACKKALAEDSDLAKAHAKAKKAHDDKVEAEKKAEKPVTKEPTSG